MITKKNNDDNKIIFQIELVFDSLWECIKAHVLSYVIIILGTIGLKWQAKKITDKILMGYRKRLMEDMDNLNETEKLSATETLNEVNRLIEESYQIDKSCKYKK